MDLILSPMPIFLPHCPQFSRLIAQNLFFSYIYEKCCFVACLSTPPRHYFWRSNSPKLSRTKCLLSNSLFQFTTKVNQLRSLLYNLKIVLLDGNFKSNKKKDCFPSCLSYTNSLMLALHHLAWAIGLALPVLLALNKTKNSFWHTQHFLCKLQLILDPNWVNQIG